MKPTDEKDFELHWHALQIMARKYNEPVVNREEWYDSYNAGLLAYQAFYDRFPRHKPED